MGGALGYSIGVGMFCLLAAYIVGNVAEWRKNKSGRLTFEGVYLISAAAAVSPVFLLPNTSPDRELIVPAVYFTWLILWWRYVRAIRAGTSGWRRLHALAHVALIMITVGLGSTEPEAAKTLIVGAWLGILLLVSSIAVRWVIGGFRKKA